MKIHDLYKSRLRNDEHFMFHTEFRDLLSAAALTYYEGHPAPTGRALTKDLCSQNVKIKVKIKKPMRFWLYLLTFTFQPHKSLVRAGRVSGRVPSILIYAGCSAKKTLNEQTSAVINILQELKGGYAADAQIIGLTEYVTLMETHNNALEDMVKGRYDEAAGKTDVVIRDARLKLDAVYDDIAARINALELLEGGGLYENFIKTLNVVIAKFNTIISARAGRKHHKRGADADADAAGDEEVGDV